MAECIWPIDVEACCEPVGLDPDDPKVISIIEQVSIMLTTWSGYQIGGCRTVRPLEPCGVCRSGCCGSGDCIVLHDSARVTEVRVDNVLVDPDDYHFDPARGTLCAAPPLRWPTADPRFTNTGTLEVDVAGREPDAWALAVAAELACELIKACTGGKCRLPVNTTQVSSLGVTVTISEDEAKYAIPAVMAWVSSINPRGATMPARIFSPEADRAAVVGARRSTWRPPWSPLS